MKRLVAIVSLCIVAACAAPSVFACEDCPDGSNCVTMTGGARICEFNPDGSCKGVLRCPQALASLQSEYRVAAVRVIPQAQPKPAAVQIASK